MLNRIFFHQFETLEFCRLYLSQFSFLRSLNNKANKSVEVSVLEVKCWSLKEMKSLLGIFLCDWDCLMVRFTVCGARYKTRPGLTYHLSHFHSGGDEEEDHGGAAVITPSPKHQGDVPTTVGVTANSAGDIVDGRHLFLPLHCYSIVDLLNYTIPFLAICTGLDQFVSTNCFYII